jgi:hypothetical protein
MFDACRVLVRPNDRAVDRLNSRIIVMRDSIEDAIPDASGTPSDEPIVAGRVGAIVIRQVTPRCA